MIGDAELATLGHAGITNKNPHYAVDSARRINKTRYTLQYSYIFISPLC